MCRLHCRRLAGLCRRLIGLLLVLGVALPPHIAVAVPIAAPTPPKPKQPWPAPVQIYEASISLPTYPYERYQSDAYDPVYNWHFKAFDYARFRTEAPQPQVRTYRTVILENDYLRLIILPELGGRIWRVVEKATGNDLFYHNRVVMPSPWGPENMHGWFALGGIEWGLPVAEHGYAWGTSWDVTSLQRDGQQAAVTLALPRAGQVLAAEITVRLAAGEAAFTITPNITNVSKEPVRFAFWHSAALAPGKDNTPSADTRFVLPTDAVTVHSTDDSALPGFSHSLSWPAVNGRDLSRLGNWDQYLGFFEWPAAHGPFVAVYDPLPDAGVVRVFPAESARGSKVFALGWQHPLDPALYTDDGSTYVELHGGLAPTFADQVALAPGESVQWREVWYPVHGLGGITTANTHGALAWRQTDVGVDVGFLPIRPLHGRIVLRAGAQVVAQSVFAAQPNSPVAVSLFVPAGVDTGTLAVEVQDSDGVPLLVAK